MRFFFFASAESTDTDEGVACVNTAAVHRMQELVQVRNFNALSIFEDFDCVQIYFLKFQLCSNFFSTLIETNRFLTASFNLNRMAQPMNNLKKR